MDWDAIFNALVGSGPAVVILGLAVKVLWAELKRERRQKDRIVRKFIRMANGGDEDEDEEDDGEEDDEE